MSKFIPLSTPCFGGNEKKYVNEAVETAWVSTGGPMVSVFESKIADYVQQMSAVAVANGTSGLHVSLVSLGIGHGDEVIVPTLTFIAPINAVHYTGADPIFMDCDEYFNIDADKVASFCEHNCKYENGVLVNKATQKIVKAIMPVHVFGNMCKMDVLQEIAQKYKLFLIEDATEALGSLFLGSQESHAGTLGDIGVYSFNGNKIITTGGGGMIVAKNIERLNHIRYLTTQAKDNDIFYIHNEVGYNYRMTNLQAALGVAQLEQLDSFIAIKKRNFDTYYDELKEIPWITLHHPPEYSKSNYWFYALSIEIGSICYTTMEDIVKYFEAKNIQIRPIWFLNHQQKPYKSYTSYAIEKANYYVKRVINIPCSVHLSEEDISNVISSIKGLGR